MKGFFADSNTGLVCIIKKVNLMYLRTIRIELCLTCTCNCVEDESVKYRLYFYNREA